MPTPPPGDNNDLCSIPVAFIFSRPGQSPEDLSLRFVLSFRDKWCIDKPDNYPCKKTSSVTCRDKYFQNLTALFMTIILSDQNNFTEIQSSVLDDKIFEKIKYQLKRQCDACNNGNIPAGLRNISFQPKDLERFFRIEFKHGTNQKEVLLKIKEDLRVNVFFINVEIPSQFEKNILQNRDNPNMQTFLQNLPHEILDKENIPGYLLAWEKNKLTKKPRKRPRHNKPVKSSARSEPEAPILSPKEQDQSSDHKKEVTENNNVDEGEQGLHDLVKKYGKSFSIYKNSRIIYCSSSDLPSIEFYGPPSRHPDIPATPDARTDRSIIIYLRDGNNTPLPQPIKTAALECQKFGFDIFVAKGSSANAPILYFDTRSIEKAKVAFCVFRNAIKNLASINDKRGGIKENVHTICLFLDYPSVSDIKIYKKKLLKPEFIKLIHDRYKLVLNDLQILALLTNTQPENPNDFLSFPVHVFSSNLLMPDQARTTPWYRTLCGTGVSIRRRIGCCDYTPALIHHRQDIDIAEDIFNRISRHLPSLIILPSFAKDNEILPGNIHLHIDQPYDVDSPFRELPQTSLHTNLNLWIFRDTLDLPPKKRAR